MRITYNISILGDLCGPFMNTLGFYKRALGYAGGAGVIQFPKEVIEKNIYFDYLIKQWLSPGETYLQVFSWPLFSWMWLMLSPFRPFSSKNLALIIFFPLCRVSLLPFLISILLALTILGSVTKPRNKPVTTWRRYLCR